MLPKESHVVVIIFILFIVICGCVDLKWLLTRLNGLYAFALSLEIKNINKKKNNNIIILKIALRL